ncbi:MAG TPA: MFS transporter [Ktedonobacterales bacterium]|nr:MFS transporter [Ktedonobacterales bacterium]
MTFITHPARTFTPLTRRQHATGTRVLLANTFFMLFGFFAVVTVVALHFTHDLLFTVTAVGGALALRQMIQQGLDIFGGFIAERIGYRTAIVIGCVIRGFAFIGLGLAHDLPQLLAASFFIGFGGMFFDAAGSGALAALVPEHNHSRIFALQATLMNIGAALGPLAGIAIYARFGFLPVAVMAAAVFFWIAVETSIWLPEGITRRANARDSHPLTLPQLLRAILRRHSYVRVVLLLMGFWAINAQITLTVPLAGAHVAGKGGVALLLSLNAFLAIPLQYPLVRFLERSMTAIQLLAASTLLSGLGITLIFLAPAFEWQVVGIIITTFGSLAVTPIMASITAHIAPKGALAAFFGFSALSIGLGGALGQLLGGRIYDIQRAMHLPWLMALFMASIGIAITVVLLRTPAPDAIPEHDEIATAVEDAAARSGVMPAPGR